MAPTASRDKRARTCESSEERLPVPERVPRLLALKRCGRAYGFDLDFNSDPPTLIEPEWGEEYDIGLYGRIGLQCHNLQKGTNFKFKRWEKHSMQMTGSMDFYVTLEAMDPANGSVFSFQTLLRDQGRRSPLGVRFSLLNIVSRITPIGNVPVDHHWDKDPPAIHDFYKSPLPKWFSDEALACDSKKYYVVPESELHDTTCFNFSWKSPSSPKQICLDAYLPLELNSVVVETFEDYTTEAREKLKANNAIFYLSYKCCTDPSSVTLSGYPHLSTTLAGDHHAVVRKTMDGKPEHMRLEVSLTEKQEKE